jgi:hypothetical protein
MKDLPKVEFPGVLEIVAGAKIPCAVLSDGRRVLSEAGISNALGSRTGGAIRIKKKMVESGGAPLPIFAAPKGLKAFISEELWCDLTNPLQCIHGNRIADYYEATLLPQICDVWLMARDAGALHPQQLSRAKQAEILMRGLAHIGIIALVDEATGYQEVRDRKALAVILDRYLRKEFAAWAKTFPDEFYKQMFKLKGWPYNPSSVKRPSIIGKYTNDIVYERLAPGILEELQKLNPKNEQGRRKHKNFQFLTDDVGHPALSRHIHAVIALMRGSTTWDGFYRLLQRSFSKQNESIWLSLLDDE